MQKDYSYQFSGLVIPLGDAEIQVSGFAKYQIEDLGTGDYDSALVAFFYQAKIRDYDFGFEKGITEQTREALEELVLEQLNDNYELCTSLPLNEKPDNHPDENDE